MKTTDNNNHLTTIDSSPRAVLGTTGKLWLRGLFLGPGLGEQWHPEPGLPWHSHRWGEHAAGLRGGCARPRWGSALSAWLRAAGLSPCAPGCHRGGMGDPHPSAGATPAQRRPGKGWVCPPGSLCVATSSPAGLSLLPPCPRWAARGKPPQQPAALGHSCLLQLWNRFIVEGKNSAVEGSVMRTKRFAVP